MPALQYLDFDEAVTFLRTNSSTLYKWLQNGKVPAHKLGRQWRFRREELEEYLSGGAATAGGLRAEIAALAQQLGGTASHPAELFKVMLWRAHAEGFGGTLHFQPAGDGYAVTYRSHKKASPFATLGGPLFHAICGELEKSCPPAASPQSRLVFAARGEESLQAVFLTVETVAGLYGMARLHPSPGKLATLADIARDAETLEKLKRLSLLKQGIVIVTGAYGSGKTTTVYGMLHHAAEAGRNVFTLEDYVPAPMAGVNHMELASRSSEAFEKQLARLNAVRPEVTALVLDPFPDSEARLYAEAAAAARENRLVIVQTTALSLESARAVAQKHMPQGFESLLAGIVFQELVPAGKGYAAEYRFWLP